MRICATPAALPSEGTGEQAPVAEPAEPFTHHLRRIAAFGLILLGLVGVVAVLFPPGIGPSPVEGIEVTKPPWSFWWMFTLENWFGLKGILYGEIGFFALLIALPFIDRSPERYWRRRKLAMALGLLTLLGIIALTTLMAVTPAKQHLGM